MNSEKEVRELNIYDLLPNRFQPRLKFNEAAIKELATSIKEHGVIQPIVVRKIGDKYEIIAGERRYKASMMAGKKTIPAIVANLDDAESAEIALIENVQRQDLTPIEEAISYRKILDMGYTQAKLADKLGNKQSTIANKLRLLNLEEEVQEALLEEKISERHARSLLKITDSKKQVEMLNRIINERLTVRKTDEEIDKMFNNLFKKKENKEVPVPETEIKEELTSVVLEKEEKKEEELPKEEFPMPSAEEVSIGLPTEPVAESTNDQDYLSGNFFGIGNDIKIEPVAMENVPSIEVPVEPVSFEPVTPVQPVEAETPKLPNFEELFNKPVDVPVAETPVVETPDISTLPIFQMGSENNTMNEFEKVETPVVEDLEKDEDIFNINTEVVEVEELKDVPNFELPIEPEEVSVPVEAVVEEVVEPTPVQTVAPIFIPDEDDEEEPAIEEVKTEPIVEPVVEVTVAEPVVDEFKPVEEETKTELPDISDLNINLNIEEEKEELPSNEEIKKEYENVVIDVEKPTFEIENETPSLESMGLSEDSLKTEPVVKNFDLEKVTEEINKCKEILSGLGLDVRLEEFDFEDMYQVIISINK